MGQDIPCVPNKKTAGVIIGGVIAPIFFATCEDSGALPIQASDVTQMESGDEITINIVIDAASKSVNISENE
jgi:aconitate hydratase 2/2-methylisocitrate dehydratase